MHRGLIVAMLAAPLLTAAPVVFAQTPPEPAPSVDAAANSDLQAQGEAFSQDMERMSLEIEAAVAASGGDHEQALRDVDIIVARYRPSADAFADNFAAFLEGRAFEAEDETERQRFLEAREAVAPVIRAIPDQMRASVAASLEGESLGETDDSEPSPED